MKTKISNQQEMTIVEVSGFLDFETAKPFTQSIQEIYRDNKEARVVIDMSRLEFVGSSGISNFVKGLRSFNKLRMRPSYCGVKNEFKKIFRLFEDKNSFELFEGRTEAVSAAKDRFDRWQKTAQRSKSTH